MPYKAFISYSHAADGRLAPALQSALHGFAKPWYRLRAMRVFRDKTSLAVTPSLWPSIETALADSEYFVLLASPEASASQWVQREVRYWLETKPPGKLLVVLTDGEMVWDAQAGDFDWRKTNALPPLLEGAFASEPLYLDLRWARRLEHVSTRHPEFRTSVARLAATLHGRPLDELTGEDVRQHRRFVWLARAVATALALLTVASLTAAWVAVVNRRRAEDRRFVSLAQALAARAPGEATSGRDDERAALLARQAYFFNRDHGGTRLSEVDGALRAVLGEPFFSVRIDVPETELGVAAVSRDGVLAVAGRDQAVRVWRLGQRARLPFVLRQEAGQFRALGFEPDRGWLLGATDLGDVVVWKSVREGEPSEVRSLPGGGHEVKVATVSPDGGFLAVANRGAGVEVWDLHRSDRGPISICCHEAGARVSALAFSPASDRLATGGTDRTVQVWSLARPQAPLAKLVHDGPIASVAFDGDGRRLAVGTSRHTKGILKALAEGGEDLGRPQGGSVTVWEASASGWRGRVVGVHESHVVSLAFAPDGAHLASTGGGDRVVRLWDLSQARPQARDLRGHRGTVAALLFPPGLPVLVSADAGDRGLAPSSIRLWDLRAAAGAPLRLEGHRGAVVAVAWSPVDGRLASAGSSDGEVRVWDPAGGAPAVTLRHAQAFATAVAFSPDGGTIASGSGSMVGGPSAAGVRLWDAAHPELPPRQLSGHASAVESVAFSSDGALVASAGRSDGEIRIWSVRRPETPPEVVAAGTDEVAALAFAPVEPILAWGSGDGAIRLLDLRDPARAPVRQLAGHGHFVTSLAFDPSGSLLASSELGGQVLVHRPASGAPPVSARGSQGEIRSVAIDRKGEALAAGGEDGKVRVWRMAELDAEPVVLEAGSDPVYSVGFSADGEWLAAGTAGGRVLVWPRTERLLRTACEKVWRNLTGEEWTRFVGSDVECQATCEALPGCQ